MGDERFAGVLAVTGDDVDDSGWESGCGGRLGEDEGGPRCHLRGLEDDRVARGDGRQDLPRSHLQRVVPRRDRTDDAEGLPTDHRRRLLPVGACRESCELPGGAGEEAGVVDRPGDVELGGQPDRLARLLRLEGRDLLAARLELVGEAEEEVGALARGERLARRVRRLRGSDGLVDVVSGGEPIRTGRRCRGGVRQGERCSPSLVLFAVPVVHAYRFPPCACGPAPVMRCGAGHCFGSQ